MTPDETIRDVPRLTISLDAESAGIVFDALMEHRAKSLGRKEANSESNSDYRAGVCEMFMRQINVFAWEQGPLEVPVGGKL